MIICYYCDITIDIYNDVFLNALQSAKKVMPTIPRVLMTTVQALPKFPKSIIDLLHETYEIRFPSWGNYQFYPYRRCLAQSQLPGDVLFLDTDTVIKKDVSDVFEDKNFDIAPTKLSYPNSRGILTHTHNAGVCFSRSMNFWSNLVNIIEKESDNNAVEIHYSNLVNSGKYRTKHLDDKIYNFIPGKTSGKIEDAKIVHYLRHRKEMISKSKWNARLMSQLG